MVHGLIQALAIVDSLASAGTLDHYVFLLSTRADLLRRYGPLTEAATAYHQALALVTNESERRFLNRRLREVQAPAK